MTNDDDGSSGRRNLAGFLSSAPGLQSAVRLRTRRLEHPLSFRATSAVIAVGLLALVLLAGFASWSMLRVDENAAARESVLLTRAIDDERHTVAHEQQSVTVWDEAVAFTRSGDQLWMAENLGEWMNSFYGHSHAYVLNDKNEPIYAMVNSASLPVQVYDIYAPWIRPLVHDLRASMKREGDLGDLVASDVLMIRGQPSIVSVKPIVPSSSRLKLSHGEEYLHVAVKHVDAELLSRIGDRYLIENVRFRRSGTTLQGLDSVRLAGRDGGLLGYLVWDRQRPGLQLIKQASPGLAVAAMSLIGLVGWLFLRLSRAGTQINESRAQAQHLATHDGLTNLPNSAFLKALLGHALGARGCGEGKVAIHYIDLDRFTNVNNALGHQAGDELLRHVAQRLTRLAQATDVVGRMGGDEFAVLQRGVATSRDADQFAEKLVDAMAKPFDVFGEQVHIDSWIGVAMAPDDADDPFELVRMANIALSSVKHSGAQRHCMFHPDLDEETSRKRGIEQDLRDAIEQGTGLRVVYQPLYAANGASVVGAEALLRWDHPVHGSISPAAFIPVAEERGLIHQLGTYVLREACRAAKELDLPWVAVNVSTVQFQEPGFFDLVLDLLRDLGLSPDRLQIEITEGLLLDATDEIATTLVDLRLAGVKVALDDFGTGYSSLNYLHRYKVDKIKIDRSFVQNLGCTDGDAVVRAIFDLARALDLDVTAEGVETRDQWKILAGLGSLELQGFFFSKPMDPEALRGLCARGVKLGGPEKKSRFEDASERRLSA